jgi:hypothetical protein
MSFMVFFVVWFSVIGLAWWYVGRRLIPPARLQGAGRLAAWAAAATMLVLSVVPIIIFLTGKQGLWFDRLAFAGYLILGVFSLLLTGIALRDVVLLAVGSVRVLARRFRGHSPGEPDRERRRFLLHSSNLGILVLASGAAGYGFFEAHRRAAIEQLSVPLRGLPREFDGFRIVQFTDLHVGPTIKREYVERVAGQVMELKPDLIAFTGDLVDGSVSWLRDDVAPLASLTAPFGMYFVTGNHEYYSGATSWIREAERLGFDVLMNEHRIVRNGSAGIVLAGVTDYGAGDFLPEHASDPVAAMDGAPRELAHILLAHQPRSIVAAERAGFDLQLSGHTHGGQFFPWNHFATLAQPYIKGLHIHGRTTVYVSRGTGYWGPPVRLGNPPEITVITLRQA